MAQQKGTVTGLIAIMGDDGSSHDVGERGYNHRLTQRSPARKPKAQRRTDRADTSE